MKWIKTVVCIALAAAFAFSAGTAMAKNDGASVDAPPVLPVENTAWTDKLYYEIGEPVQIFVNLPDGGNCIASPYIKNVLTGEYYVFCPYTLSAMVPPGVRETTWDQTVGYPPLEIRAEFEVEWGIDLSDLETGLQVPSGLYMVEWYGAVCSFAIGYEGGVVIGDLPEEAFENGAQQALEVKFDTVLAMMEDGNYQGAIQKLTNDILPYIEDRVVDPAAQDLLTAYANYLIWLCQNP